jgi:hypothetical protein
MTINSLLNVIFSSLGFSDSLEWLSVRGIACGILFLFIGPYSFSDSSIHDFLMEFLDILGKRRDELCQERNTRERRKGREYGTTHVLVN